MIFFLGYSPKELWDSPRVLLATAPFLTFPHPWLWLALPFQGSWCDVHNTPTSVALGYRWHCQIYTSGWNKNNWLTNSNMDIQKIHRVVSRRVELFPLPGCAPGQQNHSTHPVLSQTVFQDSSPELLPWPNLVTKSDLGISFLRSLLISGPFTSSGSPFWIAWVKLRDLLTWGVSANGSSGMRFSKVSCQSHKRSRGLAIFHWKLIQG